MYGERLQYSENVVVVFVGASSWGFVASSLRRVFGVVSIYPPVSGKERISVEAASVMVPLVLVLPLVGGCSELYSQFSEHRTKGKQRESGPGTR